MNANPNPQPANDRLHSIESASQFLGGVAPSTLRQMITRGKLTRQKVGRRTLVLESELRALVQPQSRPPARPTQAPPAR